MTVYLVSYATPDYFFSQKKLEKSALNYGINKIINYNSIWLKLFHPDFIQKNSNHFKHQKGGGLWVWKPFIILETLKKIKEGDILIYFDAGIEVIHSLSPLIELVVEKNILLFSTFFFENEKFTKPETFIQMDCVNKKYKKAFQFEAGMIILKKNKYNLRFIANWASLCENFSLISDSEDPTVNHRHDQSILTNLAIKEDITPYRSPHQFTNNLKSKEHRIENEYLDKGNHLPKYLNGCYADCKYLPTDSNYGTLLNLHRSSEYRRLKIPIIFLGLVYSTIKTYFFSKTLNR